MERIDPISLETRSAAIKLAASDKPVRIAMRGSSMLPDLREGMVLEIRSQRVPCVGDIVVFRGGERLVAHRAVALRRDAIVCAGDAQPDSIEHVPHGDIIGVVERVYDAQGRQVDTPAWRLRGILRARFRRTRAMLFHAIPQLRRRTYVSLFTVMSAVVRGDDTALVEAMRRDAPWRLAAMARRHRCAAAICEALERMPGGELADALQASLRKDRWSALVRQTRLAAQLKGIVQTLRTGGFEPVLLKGAHRVACGTPESFVFDSHDIDVLVSPESVNGACDALRSAGYRQLAQTVLDYDRHHHASPLFPRTGLPVEVHRALTNHAVNLPITWDALKTHTVMKQSAVGDVRVLDSVGTALHLTVHCLQRPALREIALLSKQLLRLDPGGLAEFRQILSRERRYAVPLNAAVALAARMGGISWQCDSRSKRYAEWMLMREDLPRPLRARPECVDAWLAARSIREKPLRAALFDGYPGSVMHVLVRAFVRVAAAAMISIFLRLWTDKSQLGKFA